MKKLPKNIDSIEEFSKYYDDVGYNYTIDDFMKDYKMSLKKSRDLLKTIDHISISQSLYRQHMDRLKRKEFYNRENVLKELIINNYVKFKYNFLGSRMLENGEHDIYASETSKRDIPKEFLLRKPTFFINILKGSRTVSDIAKEAGNETSAYKRKLNRDVQSLEGIRIDIGNKIKRYYPLYTSLNPEHALIAYKIVDEIIKFKRNEIDQ